ncbi:hypothetical protein ACIBHX_39055 [Nonomuraea sp. NPDC050536]|uniref:hypothetical protein n=1 Tax=Nonomuraea sp. NPDC050536 TaxID=3364366 RepID=UPI0037CBE0C1
MAVDERTISEALRTMAARATPADPAPLARRALRSRVRRRGTRWVAGLVTAAALTAYGVVQLRPVETKDPTLVGPIPVNPSPMYPTPTPSPTNSGAPALGPLPANDSERFGQVLACMPHGGTVHNMDGERVLPQHGVPQDFRWLVEAADKEGVTRLVGSLKGFVLCTPGVRGVSYPTDALFAYWGVEPPGDLAFDAALSVDVYDLQMQSMINPPKDGDPLFHVVAGRVKPEVKRVEAVWKDGRRAEAVLGNGFFIIRTRAHKPYVHGDLRTVTAYDGDGRVLAVKDGAKVPGMGAPDDND